MSLVEERNRLSRDLHDTVEHSLIGIMLLTDTVSELMGSDPLMARAELESTHALAKAGLEQVRLAVWDLQPLAITSNPLEMLFPEVFPGSMMKASRPPSRPTETSHWGWTTAISWP